MTPDEVNALPERVRKYIHALETNADPAGMVRQNVLLRDENAQLRALVEELQKDAERFAYWLEPKVWNVNEYLDGIAAGWSSDHWREWTDKQMQLAAAMGSEGGK